MSEIPDSNEIIEDNFIVYERRKMTFNPRYIKGCPPDKYFYFIKSRIELTEEELSSLRKSIELGEDYGFHCSGHPDDDPQHLQIAHYVEHKAVERLIDSRNRGHTRLNETQARTLHLTFEGQELSGFYFRKGLASEEDQVEAVEGVLRVLNRVLSNNHLDDMISR